MKNSQKAFTLVEILLTMAIIGVVGILAVSNAKKDTDEAEKELQLKRSFEILDTALTAAVAENGNTTYWGSSVSEKWNILAQQIKFSKNCGTGQGCWRNEKILEKNNNESSRNLDTDTDFGKGILVNGSSIAVDFANSSQIFVDVNGPDRGLNKYGDDVFMFRYSGNGDLEDPETSNYWD